MRCQYFHGEEILAACLPVNLGENIKIFPKSRLKGGKWKGLIWLRRESNGGLM